MRDVGQASGPSGLRVTWEQVPAARSVHLGAILRAGARHETAETNGLAHFLEHMAFKGGAERDARVLARAIEALGGQCDAYTTHDYTCYLLQVLPDHLDAGLGLLAELIVGYPAEPEQVALERQVVLEEILEAEDSPADVAGEICAEQAWGEHGLARPVLGRAATVAGFTAGLVDAFRREHYTAERLVLGAVGQLPEELLDRLARPFAALPAASPPLDDRPPEFRPGLAARRLEVDQVHVCLAAPADGVGHPDRQALWLLDSLLGATMSSRLFQEVRERRGLAYQIQSSWQAQVGCGLLTIEAVAHPKRLTELLTVTMGEIEALLAGGLTEEDLAWAKEYSRATLILATEAPGARLGRRLRTALFGLPDESLETLLANLAATSLDDVERVARRILGAGQWALGCAGPVTAKREAAWWKVIGR